MTTTPVDPAPASFALPPPTPPAHGLPYNRLAVRHWQRWWITLFGTLGMALAYVMVAGVCYGAVVALAGTEDLPPYLEVGVGLASVAVLLPVVLLAVRFVQWRPVGSISSVTGRLRWGWLGLCLPVAAVMVILMVAGSTGLLMLSGDSDVPVGGGAFAGAGPFVGGLALVLVLVPVQAAAEEYLCRGWLLQAVGAFARSPWPAIAAQAVVFAALHGWGTPWGFADLVVYGVVAGWLTVRTGGLEAAIALHVATNVIVLGIGAFDGSLTLDETAADMPWQGALVDVATLLGYAALITLLACRRQPATHVPSEQ